MDQVLSDDQRMIRDEAARFLADRAASDRVRYIVAGGTGHDSEPWAAIGDLGWCGMGIDEAHGGLGLGKAELMLLLEAVGRRLACVPFWSTSCLAVPLLQTVATDAAGAMLLPRIAAGEAATVAWSDATSPSPQRNVTIVATPVDGGYRLDGIAPRVRDLSAARIVLVPARVGDRLGLFLMPDGQVNGAAIHALESLDATLQLGALELDGCAVPASARLDAGGFDADEAAAATALAQLGLAAEQAGAARGAMDLTLDYISSRVQFGRTIASFQAVKHRCARLEVDLAEARSLVHGAAANPSDDPRDRMLEASAARALASDLLFRAAEESIQLHGGVGFTWEYDPHLYFKRAQVTSVLFGPAHSQFEVIAADLLDGETSS